jgi:WhiB family redox-sensing transcriptional regulator
MFEAWIFQAACGLGDADTLFVEGALQHSVKRICKGCPVRYECLAAALDNRISTGVWGGMSERERRTLLRQHPEVSSWRSIFDAETRKRQAAARRDRPAGNDGRPRSEPAGDRAEPAGNQTTGRQHRRAAYQPPVLVGGSGLVGSTVSAGRHRRRSGPSDR